MLEPNSCGDLGLQFRGMSLRDYFAAAALAHIPLIMARNEKNCSYDEMAKHAYQQADAMLIARTLQPQPLKTR
jgi:hypothetical protein